MLLADMNTSSTIALWRHIVFWHGNRRDISTHRKLGWRLIRISEHHDIFFARDWIFGYPPPQYWRVWMCFCCCKLRRWYNWRFLASLNVCLCVWGHLNSCVFQKLIPPFSHRVPALVGHARIIAIRQTCVNTGRILLDVTVFVYNCNTIDMC